MRAIYLKEIEPLEQVEIVDKETIHHLNNVVRIQSGDQVLLLNGSGTQYEYLVKQVERKRIQLKKIKETCNKRFHRISILLGLPKKEYFEDILRSSIQLGIEEVYYFNADNTPRNTKLNEERIDKIIKSSIEQSNNAFAIQVTEVGDIEEFLKEKKFNQKLLMSVPNKSESFSLSKVQIDESALLAIGPEGGYSECEEKMFLESNFSKLFLPTNILKSTEAISAGVGALLGASMACS